VASPKGSISVENEVLANIQAQPLGTTTVQALALPLPFLRRVADRVIRASYEERYRMVVGGPSVTPLSPAADGPEPPGPAPSERVTVGPGPELSPEVLTYRRSLPEARPALRGFRAAMPGQASERWPSEAPDSGVNPLLAAAADHVARRLAPDGLLRTLAAAIEIIGPSRFTDFGIDQISLLRRTGLPVDLLTYFGDGPESITRQIVDQVATGTPASLQRLLASVPFSFRQSCPGFRVIPECGTGQIRLIRLQLTSGAYWGGRGGGGSLDTARQLVESLPGVQCVASIEERHLSAFLDAASRWSISPESKVQVLPESLPVAQWAQDSGKPGSIAASGAASGSWATLVPRYASRGEDGSILIPGETFLADSLEAAGLGVARSPLLFQGGNLMAVDDPATKDRVLLAGEAEIFRNTALGLTAEQATEALRVELGADRCVVLPAVSFHIDYELSLREHNGRLLAFVNDTAAAMSIILSCGIDAILSSGAMDVASARAAREHLDARRLPQFLEAAAESMRPGCSGPDQFTPALAACFSTGPASTGVANLQTFLLAMDLLAASLSTPSRGPEERHAKANLEAIRRRASDRRGLHRRLESMGCRLVLVPSLGEGERGINYLNGIHDKGRYLMPAFGGLYQQLDQAAAETFRRMLGPEIQIIPISCWETQRRSGAIRCATSVYSSMD